MELPIALLVLAVVVLTAWAAPGFMATVFVLVCALAGYVVTMALLARRGRR